MMTTVTYRQTGDYLYPNLTIPEEHPVPIGKYGRMRKQYLKENRNAMYNRLLLSGKLEEHLLEIEETANSRMEQLLQDMMQTENISEQMKEENPMKWVGMVNNLRNRIEEMILQELIYN